MIELLIGFGVASWMGMGGTYVVLLLFAFAYPRLFRVAWWMLMLPIMSIGPAILFWLFGGFFLGWNAGTATIGMIGGTLFGLAFCAACDPKPSE